MNRSDREGPGDVTDQRLVKRTPCHIFSGEACEDLQSGRFRGHEFGKPSVQCMGSCALGLVRALSP